MFDNPFTPLFGEGLGSFLGAKVFCGVSIGL